MIVTPMGFFMFAFDIILYNLAFGPSVCLAKYLGVFSRIYNLSYGDPLR